MNKVVLLGRITKNPELKTTSKAKDAKVVTNFTLAVDQVGKDKNGEKLPALFMGIVAWDKKAEVVVKYCKKGALLCVAGRLSQRTYEKDGVTRYVTEVIADEVQLLNSKSESTGFASMTEIEEAYKSEFNAKAEGLKPEQKKALKAELGEKYAKIKEEFVRKSNDGVVEDDDDLPF